MSSLMLQFELKHAMPQFSTFNPKIFKNLKRKDNLIRSKNMFQQILPYSLNINKPKIGIFAIFGQSFANVKVEIWCIWFNKANQKLLIS